MTAITTAKLKSPVRGVRLWIASMCFLVFAMVVIGGITRLTRSGLSIVEWKPITGVIPPISEADWHEAFDAYRQFPEYQHVNHGMTLDEFKEIFFWEYLHRLIGRFAGLVLGVPLIVLALRRRLSKRLLKRLTIALALGGVQGLVGWYMVKSGLVNMPRVSHYRLATHLGLAFFMFAFLYWTFLDLKVRQALPKLTRPGFKHASIALTTLVAVQIIYGAFVAGMRAGYGFNTFPLMNGQIIPDGLLVLSPAWTNIVENPATVQFIHRMIAWTLALSIAVFWWQVRKADASAEVRRAVNILAAAVTLQFALGVATLVLVVPVPLAALHQVGAFGLLAASVYTTFIFYRSTRSAASTPWPSPAL